MLVCVCKSKIHNATITSKNKNYIGSLKVDKELLKIADIQENEVVLAINLENGERFYTYVMPGKKGEISLQGGTARLGEKGDKLIIMSFGYVNKEEAKKYKPKVIILDKDNKPIKKK